MKIFRQLPNSPVWQGGIWFLSRQSWWCSYRPGVALQPYLHKQGSERKQMAYFCYDSCVTLGGTVPHLLGDLRWRYRLLFRLRLETSPTFLLSLRFICGSSLSCFHRYRPGKEHLEKGWRKIGKKTGFPVREPPPSVQPSVFRLLASFPK